MFTQSENCYSASSANYLEDVQTNYDMGLPSQTGSSPCPLVPAGGPLVVVSDTSGFGWPVLTVPVTQTGPDYRPRPDF